MAPPVRSAPTQGLNEAQSDIDARRAAVVAAIAAEGSAGRERVAQQQAALHAQRAAAVSGALGQAARRGAPQQMLDKVGARVTLPANQAVADIGEGQARRDRSTAALSSAGDLYFRQAAAAVPALREIAGRERSRTEAQMTEAANAREMERELALMRLTEAREQQAFEREKRAAELAGGLNPLADLSDSELKTRLYGAGRIGMAEAAAGAARGNRGWLGNAAAAGRAVNTPLDEYALRAGLDAGLDPALVAGVTQREPTEPKAAPKEADVQIMAKPYFKKIETELKAALDAEGADPEAIRQAIINDYAEKYPRVVEILLKQYEDDLL